MPVLNQVSRGEVSPRREEQTKCREGRAGKTTAKQAFPFSLQRPPIWNSMGRGAVPIVCGPWLAALCHLLIHAAVLEP